MPHDPPTHQFSLSELCDAFNYGVRLGRSRCEQASCSPLATKHDVEQATELIMSAISNFAAKQAAFNQRQGAAIDAAVASVQSIVADIQGLNDKITELQNSVGGVTPEDQALIDDLEAQGDALSVKSESVAAALAALDAQTPPVVPNPAP